ncbi:hypothetical protein DPC23_23160 [Salmonella enterica subsp. enterica serovar Koketime]|nr:hypothetical protein [Salmonella enterica subsp. enterica serovar Koketime]
MIKTLSRLLLIAFLITSGSALAVAYFNLAARQESQPPEALLDRVKKDPAFSHPDAPFVFINLMEMAPEDATMFIADWKIRSQLTRQQAGSYEEVNYLIPIEINRDLA